ncbi:hypothetical protein PFICI_00535 [Pestalotiopsis fici W106-1]|uniref:Uncharacterized protein n=1 Tax=Pestalotiopsis fici (strain W106-1 / CGMCC3.15140) TaxID=1229662 RepID=W3XMI8_PESFW|nr:uncharacterized protein PFICI_00535 [Pestalotiopsis fici W106-1]ETS86707.1 hypothetical protein PFICI_00535 [Pestalotiopsis fici W106-1]
MASQQYYNQGPPQGYGGGGYPQQPQPSYGPPQGQYGPPQGQYYQQGPPQMGYQQQPPPQQQSSGGGKGCLGYEVCELHQEQIESCYNAVETLSNYDPSEW